tara:strand:- start:327 stop:470 length:144 start_codon:yes stop_codon:yes gene_type:complete
MITQFNGYSVLVDLEETGLALLVTEDSDGVVETEVVEVDDDSNEESS